MDIVIKNVDVLSLPICVFNNKELFDYLVENIKKYLKENNIILEELIKNNYINVIKYIRDFDVNDALLYACVYNKINIVEYTIKKGATNLRLAACNSAEYGHNDIVYLLLKYKIVDCFSSIMAFSSTGGHIDIVKLMIKKGANDWNRSLKNAAKNGHIDIVKLMIEKGANDLNLSLLYAARRGHIDIVKLMIEKGANDFNNAMIGSAEWGHIDIVKLMIEKGANDFNKAMNGACIDGHIDIVKLMIEKGANDFNSSNYIANYYNHSNIVRLIGATNY